VRRIDLADTPRWNTTRVALEVGRDWNPGLPLAEQTRWSRRLRAATISSTPNRRNH